MKKILLVALLSFLTISQAVAVVISGKVVSQTDSKPIPAAAITLKDKDNTIILQSQADEKGNFKIDAPNITSDNILTASFVGYETENIAIIAHDTQPLNLGNIYLAESKATQLEEVTVTADRIIRKVNKYIVIPQKEEVDRASKALELLEQMPLPGLQVDRVMQTIKINNGSPVLMVNGKERDAKYFSNLDPDKILRVEYNNIPGIRYADRGASGVINFILKEAEDGGSITAQFQSALTTGFINGYVNGTYNYKKSQFSLMYNCGYRDYDKWLANSNEKFIGGSNYIERDQRGVNSPMYYFDNTIATDYTYMHAPNTMLIVNFKSNFCPSSGGNDGHITETRNGLKSEYNRILRRKSNTYNPTLDIFFSKKMNNGQSLELNAVGNISHGYSKRSLWYNYEVEADNQEILYETDNDGWSLAAEAAYGKEFKTVATRFGVQYLHNYAENEYLASDNLSKMKKDNTYIYGEISGKIGKLGYNVGSGIKILAVNDYNNSRTFTRNLTTATLQVPINNNWSLRYNLQYIPQLPSLGALSPVVSQTDDITYSTGNPDLKPSETLKNEIRADFQSNKFTASLVANYLHTYNPILSSTLYDAENGYFIYTTENEKYLNRVTIGTQLSYKKLFNHFNISVSAYYNRFQSKGKLFNHSLNDFYSNLNIYSYFGNWSFGLGQCLAGRKTLNGTNISEGERMSQIFAQYKHRNFYFAAMMLCPFQKDGYKYQTTRLSRINPGYVVNWTKNNGNMLILSISYQANFGKSFKKNRKTLSNGGYDNGMVQ